MDLEELETDEPREPGITLAELVVCLVVALGSFYFAGHCLTGLAQAVREWQPW